MKKVLAGAVAGLILVTAIAMPAFARSKTDRISIRYVTPENPSHQYIYTHLKQRGALEKLQKILSPLRLPRTLQILLNDCDGDPDAFYDYDDTAITICYEYIEDLWEKMPSETTPSGIAPADTIVGPVFEASLHEVGHALFDMLDLPVLGREEDAADQVAAYILLQFGDAEARRLIDGTVHAYGSEARQADPCRSLKDYANEHGTPAQRAFNLMCIAYGSNEKLYGYLVSKGYLPEKRAEFCVEEYEQVLDAFEILIYPHVNFKLAKKALDGAWLCGAEGDDVSEKHGKCPPVPLK